MKVSQNVPSLFCLVILIGFPSASTVLLSPALPAMVHFFGVSADVIQQVITVYVAGYAVGQLLYSPIANRFGRKPAIHCGIILYLISCVVCFYGAHTAQLHWLLWGRFLMGLGASVGMVISFTIINDVYSGAKARSVVGYTVLSYAFMPAIGVMIGGLLTTHVSWMACFYAYVLYGFFVWAVSLRLPETLEHKHLDALQFKRIIKNYVLAFANKRLIGFSIIYGLMSGFVYVIASGAPFIGVDHIGLSASTYSLCMLLPYSGLFLGALLAGRFGKCLSAYRLLSIGYSVILIGALLMLGAFALGWVHVWTLILPLFVLMMGFPVTYSGASTMALEGYPDKAGGSAAMTFITMAISFGVSWLYSIAPDTHPIAMPSAFLILWGVACVMLLWVMRYFQAS
jgi:DHA1 family bicyclomycin/chloramphenicol resistance-like MFS transporter